ncbi:MAG: flagellar biosynthetic protein FliR [Acidobacteria bacterium]|nr:flagellar biosynthetic protein FliR [Acidobacteriota bacterium]
MILEFSTAWLINFTLLLARTGAFVVFIPIPGMRSAPPHAKIVLAAVLAVILAPLASVLGGTQMLSQPGSVWALTALMLPEAAFGLASGAAVALLIEAFGLGAQMLGFQAGYSYVNMVDPATQVDATILNVFLSLLGSLLFFVFDLHLHVVQVFADSLRAWPLGSFRTRPADALMMIQLGASVMETGVRLAAPVVGVLLLIDLTLGLLNQVNARLQLLTLAFPIKIIAAIALLYPLILVTPSLFYSLAEEMIEVLRALASR